MFLILLMYPFISILFTPFIRLSFTGLISQRAIYTTCSISDAGIWNPICATKLDGFQMEANDSVAKGSLNPILPKENTDIHSHARQHQTVRHIEPAIPPRCIFEIMEAHMKLDYLFTENILKDW
jgi:hypothetical protein